MPSVEPQVTVTFSVRIRRDAVEGGHFLGDCLAKRGGTPM